MARRVSEEEEEARQARTKTLELSGKEAVGVSLSLKGFGPGWHLVQSLKQEAKWLT